MIPTNPEAIAFAKFFLGIGLPTIGIGVWLRQREIAPKHWLQVSGIITSVSIVKQATGDIYVGSVSIPIVEYEYRHNGQTFKSTRRRASNYARGDKISAEEVTSRYSVGSSVNVFINPK